MFVKNEVILLHVALGHVDRQAGTGRLGDREILRALAAVTHGERAFQVQVGRFLEPIDQIFARELPQGVAGLLGFAHVALHEPAVGLIDLRQRLAGDEVHDFIAVHGLVRLAPTQNGKMNHSVLLFGC